MLSFSGQPRDAKIRADNIKAALAEHDLNWDTKFRKLGHEQFVMKINTLFGRHDG